jgi:uncharacterized protein (DUF924 family)
MGGRWSAQSAVSCEDAALSDRRRVMAIQPEHIVVFWRAAGPDRWFRADPAFDALCRAHCLDAHFAAARRELDAWQNDAEGALALVLLLDQIPRNVFRGSAHAYATDPLARHFAGHAIARGLDAICPQDLRGFLYLPFQHSEDLADQARAIALYAGALGDPAMLPYARRHHDVIARFGRFPHRNGALGRINTAEEQAWLEAGGGW